MLLYTAIEYLSASWAKFTWDLPEQTDWQTNMSESITFPHYVVGGNDVLLLYLELLSDVFET